MKNRASLPCPLRNAKAMTGGEVRTSLSPVYLQKLIILKLKLKNFCLYLLFAFLLTSCEDEKVTDGFDFDYFSAYDKDSNKIGISVRSFFQIESELRDELKEKYGRFYKDSFLLPITSGVIRSLLSNYSAVEIYNYKRGEIEQTLKDLIKVEFKSNDIYLETFFISSVKLSDELRTKLENEHINKMNSIEIENIESDTFKLKDIGIILRQEFPSENNPMFSCHSSIYIIKNSKKVDSLKFREIEAVGGYYGFRNAQKIENHFVVTKHGDYDGRTIIINQNGKIFNLIGGQPFLDKEQNYLFSIFDSDLSGFSIFDLTSDSLLLAIEHFEVRPKSFHKAFNNRHFITFYDDETYHESIWEFEPELERIMQVDLDSTQINKSNELTSLIIKK